MEKRKSVLLGAFVSLLFYGLTIFVIFVAILLFEHEDVALLIQLIFSVIVIIMYSVIKSKLCKIRKAGSIVYDISFLAVAIISISIYWRLVNSPLTRAYLSRAYFFKGLEFFLAMLLFICATILLIISRFLIAFVVWIRNRR